MKMSIFDIKQIITRDLKEFDFVNDMFGRSAVISLVVHDLLGGEIYCIAGVFAGDIYYNKIDNQYYNLAFNRLSLVYNNNDIVNVDDLLDNNQIQYDYLRLKIELLKMYLLFLEKKYKIIEDYLKLVELIPFFKELYKQNIIAQFEENSFFCDELNDIRKLMRNIEKTYPNIQHYLEIQDKLKESEDEYRRFKNKILVKNKEI